MTLKLAKAHF